MTELHWENTHHTESGIWISARQMVVRREVIVGLLIDACGAREGAYTFAVLTELIKISIARWDEFVWI